MKKYSIENGNFSENGNFNGYPAAGGRIHIPGRLMASIGLTADKPITFPFYILAEEKEITPFVVGTKTPQTNPDGTLLLVKRQTATSAYLTKEAMFTAANTSRTLELEGEAHFNKSVKELGLTDADVQAFANASI
jgi:hypothetical protein